MRTKFTSALMLLSSACTFAALKTQNTAASALLAYTALSFALVGLAYAFNKPHLMLKLPSGQISKLGRVLFLPFHLLSGFSLFLQRCFSDEAPFSWIDESVMLGRIPLRRDQETLQSHGIRSVLDLTSELEAAPFVRNLQYMSVPIMDGTPPSLDQIKACVEWIRRQLAEGSVLVHCALGHGRSATLAAAFLVSRHSFTEPSIVIETLEAARPGISLNKAQMAVLCDHIRRSTPTRDSDLTNPVD